MKEITIKNKIHTIRGKPVMLDSDLAELYKVTTGNLNKAVKRNLERFPKEFMFQLTKEEYDGQVSQNVIPYLGSQIATSKSLRCQNGTLNNSNLKFQSGISSLQSQNATLNNKNELVAKCDHLNNDNLRCQIGTSSLEHGGRRYLPHAFTEQGVAMLSSVLRSKMAIKVSIQIMDAFVQMRKLISSNLLTYQRLDKIEHKQLEHDQKFEKVFKAIESKDIKPSKGIFFNGQVFDAYKFISDLIRSAKKEIILIDNYIDDSVLTLFTKRKKDVKVIIYTKEITKQLKQDLEKHNKQYSKIEIKKFNDSHDRFLFIDNNDLYHIGASLKDLGKKWFAFSKFDKKVFELKNKLMPPMHHS